MCVEVVGPVHGRERRRRATPTREQFRRASSATSGTVHREREEDGPERAHHQQDAVGEHEILGRAAAALFEQERVAQDAEHERARSTSSNHTGLPTSDDFSNAHRQYARIVTLDATART